MAFTEKEVYEFLSAYPQDTIPDVLNQLGYGQGTEEYPDDVVEKAESIYRAMGIAADIQKRIAASTGQENQGAEIVIQQRTAIAAEIMEAQGITLPVETILAIAQSALQEGRELGHRVNSLRKAGYIAELQAGNAEFVQEILSVMSGSSSAVQEIFTPENIQVMVSSAVPQVATPDVQAFLAGLDERKQRRNQLAAAQQEARAALPRPKVDVKAFLAARP